MNKIMKWCFITMILVVIAGFGFIVKFIGDDSKNKPML